jgi:uncharacterized protein (TIGR03435 family)
MHQAKLERQPYTWGRRILIGLAMSALAMAEMDLSGQWVGGPFVVNLKQDGNKLTGTVEASADERYPLKDGAIDGDRVTFSIGTFQFDLRLDGDAMKGEMTMEQRSVPLILQRAAAAKAGGALVFEVASVKRSAAGSGSGSNMRLDPGRLTCVGVTLQALLALAYNVKNYQISGPGWLDTERYEIAAKFPAATPVDRVGQILQALLVERFHLAVRRESRDMPVYVLVADKDGFKLKETEIGPSGTSSSPGKMTATKISMPRFAEFLSSQVDRPVLDLTGIRGIFDITLEWARDANAAADTGPSPDIYTAIRQQLGLKLEMRRTPVEMLIVEHADKTPVEN